jgi:PII-like signaling protein
MLQAQIYIDKDELIGSQLLYEYIFDFLIHHQIKGATAFQGVIGYGSGKLLMRPGALFSFDETPMIITFTDEDEKVKEVLVALRKVFKGGLVVTLPVQTW